MTLSEENTHHRELAFTQAVVTLSAAVEHLGKTNTSAQKPALPRRGLSRVEAAQYIGVGASTFDNMVKEGGMPKPVRIGSRTVWDIHALDTAFDGLVTAEIRRSSNRPAMSGRIALST